ncbi:Hcp family type VI secretion system effector [Actinobacillus equuli]|uniref:Hcp family type VI secretion system effector n=1 Tax=Actinobacillus equuli TaxID=718 RepID=UPI00244279C0|nr:Hcp family type VI secretion system effector [Actinobacillus equuli]WGE74495.1 Hcp family type VI secretion system effector [Actinobacillus equuli subsp. haemolyticus]
MPTPRFISIEGSKQGKITAGAFTEDSVGNVYVEGHEDEIMAQAISHIVTVPTDPQSGQPSGQRVHKAFKFTCSLNKAVPLMYNALASGEMLPKVAVTWFRTSIDGRQEEFFSTVLEDAVIVDMNLVMPNAQDPSNAPYTQLLEVSMSYRKINWDHTIAGTSGSDDWRRPQV